MYKVGDFVKIIHRTGGVYEYPFDFTSSKAMCAGVVTKIIAISENQLPATETLRSKFNGDKNLYLLEIDHGRRKWSSSMFMPYRHEENKHLVSDEHVLDKEFDLISHTILIKKSSAGNYYVHPKDEYPNIFYDALFENISNIEELIYKYEGVLRGDKRRCPVFKTSIDVLGFISDCNCIFSKHHKKHCKLFQCDINTNQSMLIVKSKHVKLFN